MFEIRFAPCAAHDEQIREAVHVDAVQGLHPVRPALDSFSPPRPTVSKPGAALVVGADLEARGEDQAVDGVVPPATQTPVSSMRSTPFPPVSTRWTFGRL